MSFEAIVDEASRTSNDHNSSPWWANDSGELKTADDKMHEKLPSMQRVKSNNCKVDLRLIVGDLTSAALFLGSYVTYLVEFVSYTLSGDLSDSLGTRFRNDTTLNLLLINLFTFNIICQVLIFNFHWFSGYYK